MAPELNPNGTLQLLEASPELTNRANYLEPPDMLDQKTATRLCNEYDADAALSFSRATTALYFLFLALHKTRGKGEVIVPSICCESVALAAHYAGHEVKIADVDSATGCISIDYVKGIISRNTRAIVLVYTFGILFDALPWRQLADSHDCFLIEDLCQAIGGELPNGKVPGRTGDAAVLSFANDKILPGSGGVLLLRENSPEMKMTHSVSIESSPMASDERTLLARNWRNFSHALYELHRAQSDFDPSPHFKGLLTRIRPLFVYDRDPEFLNADQSLDELRDERSRREYRSKYLLTSVDSNPSLTPLKSDGLPMWWRLPFLASSKSQAQKLTNSLRMAGLPASNHYFPLHILFGTPSLPNASDIGGRIINLWTDDTMEDHQLDLACSIINQSLAS